MTCGEPVQGPGPHFPFGGQRDECGRLLQTNQPLDGSHCLRGDFHGTRLIRERHTRPVAEVLPKMPDRQQPHRAGQFRVHGLLGERPQSSYQ